MACLFSYHPLAVTFLRFLRLLTRRRTGGDLLARKDYTMPNGVSVEI